MHLHLDMQIQKHKRIFYIENNWNETLFNIVRNKSIVNFDFSLP